MKKIEAIVSSLKVRSVDAALLEARFSALTIAAAVGFGQGVGSSGELPVPMTVLEIVVGNWQVEAVLEIIAGCTRTGRRGDGIIQVSLIEQAVRIRTGERHHDAIRSHWSNRATVLAP